LSHNRCPGLEDCPNKSADLSSSPLLATRAQEQVIESLTELGNQEEQA